MPRSVPNAFLRVFVVLGATVLGVAAFDVGEATAAPGSCVKAGEADAPQMFDGFNAALATQHPDKVTRLFAVEALHIGHQAPKPRTGYMDIRDYYLYFLTAKPQAHVTQRHMHIGCGFVIDEGVLEWRFAVEGQAPVTAHYFMLHEYGPGGWRIAHYHDVAIEAPKPLAMARKVAVAGFLKRAPGAQKPAQRTLMKTLPSPEPGLFDDYKPGVFRDGVPSFD